MSVDFDFESARLSLEEWIRQMPDSELGMLAPDLSSKYTPKLPLSVAVGVVTGRAGGKYLRGWLAGAAAIERRQRAAVKEHAE